MAPILKRASRERYRQLMARHVAWATAATHAACDQVALGRLNIRVTFQGRAFANRARERRVPRRAAQIRRMPSNAPMIRNGPNGMYPWSSTRRVTSSSATTIPDSNAPDSSPTNAR